MSSRKHLADKAFQLARKAGKKVCESKGEHTWLYVDEEYREDNEPTWLCLLCGVTSNEEDPIGVKRYN